MQNHIKNGAKYLVSLSLVALISACGVDGNTGSNNIEDGSSQFVGATVIDDVNAATVLAYVKGGIDANATNAFEYKAVKITYNTVGQNDEPIVASGLLVIPTPTETYKAYLASIGKSFSVSMLCNNHGTIFLDSEAPTNVEVSDGIPNYAQALLMTGYAGFASIMPDYIGYGASNSVTHPYIMKKSSARASLDMIKASMKYMEESGVILNHQLYISGYSEGGYNAMALTQSVENGALPTVTLMGVAPMAGPYNVEDLANIEINASKTMEIPAFLGYLADSYAYYYDDLDLNDITVAAASVVHPLFSGAYDTVPIQMALGLTTNYGFKTYKADALFKSTFITNYQATQNGGIRARFIENNLDNWTPRSKMNLIQCLDDEVIPFSESSNTYTKFKTNGADVTLTGLPTSILSQQIDATHPFVHSNCGSTAYGVAVKWFDAIRQGDI